MADEIIEKWSSLKITQAEDQIVSLDNDNSDIQQEAIALSIVGKVLTDRPYNFEAFKRTMNQIWAISKGAIFCPVENNLFIVQFAHARDRAKVMDGCPWTFDQSLVLMREIEGSAQPSNITLTHCPFWMRIYNLPFDSRTEKDVKTIAGSIGEVIEVEKDEVQWDRSARVKIMMNITKPIRRLQHIRNKAGGVSMIEFKYERLPTFCYVCGLIGHIERDCGTVAEEDRVMEKQWGSWLRASPRRGRLKMQEETQTFIKCCKTLNFDITSPLMSKSNHELEVVNVGTGDETGGVPPFHGQPVVSGVEDGGQKGVREDGGSNIHAPREMGETVGLMSGVRAEPLVPCAASAGAESGGVRGEEVLERAQGGTALFNIGAGSPKAKTFKKGMRKGGQAHNHKRVEKGVALASKGTIASTEKRKSMAEEDDAFDVVMTDYVNMYKRLKQGDESDASVDFLKVAEVGMVQPREGQ